MTILGHGHFMEIHKKGRKYYNRQILGTAQSNSLKSKKQLTYQIATPTNPAIFAPESSQENLVR